ncbi:PTS transporter subunit EIIC [Bacillus sp. N9]
MQIIIGSGTVNKVFKEFAKLAGLAEMSTKDVKDAGAQKLNPLQRFVKMLSDIFVPIIPAIVAGGLLMGINNILTAPDLFIKGKSLIDAYPGMTDLAALINTFANAAFVFLPILIGFSATQRFGGTPILVQHLEC